MRKRDIEKLINSWNDNQWLADGDTRSWIMLVDGDWRNKYQIVWCGSFRMITEANTYRELCENLKEWIERRKLC